MYFLLYQCKSIYTVYCWRICTQNDNILYGKLVHVHDQKFEPNIVQSTIFNKGWALIE